MCVSFNVLVFSHQFPSHMKTRCPGEPGSPSYEASVPLLGPAVLTFDGTVSMFEKHGDNQYFSVQVWHYVGKNNDGKSPMIGIWAQYGAAFRPPQGGATSIYHALATWFSFKVL
ncbi:hypothetical protein V8E54_014261 [Elaphomyces granulatus]